MRERRGGARERLSATVFGRVQGVGFRWFVRDRAEAMGLVGWVRNRTDGSVELVAEGPSEALTALLEDLHQGPRGAAIARVEAVRGPAVGGLSDFDIRAGYHLGD